MRAFKFIVIGVFAMIIASVFLPDVIRIPKRWPPKLPRLELVPTGADSAQQPDASVAERVDSAAAQLPPVAMATDSPAVAPPPPAPPVELRTRGTLPSKPASTEPHRRRAKRPVAPPPEPEDVSAEGAWNDPPSSMVVPVKITTEVTLVAPTRRDTAAASDSIPVPGPVPGAAATAPGSPLEPWPMVCGVVVDASGAAVEGASVQIESQDVSDRTDAKGRFCLPSPSRHVSLIVEAEGRGRVTQVVELVGRSTQVQIALPNAR